MQKTLKIRAGKYAVFHVGPSAYIVEVAGVTVGDFRALGPASAYASQNYFNDRDAAAAALDACEG